MSAQFADRELADIVASINASSQSGPSNPDIDVLRSGSRERAARRPTGPEMHSIKDLKVGTAGPRIRVYRPTATRTAVVIYFHGGGWVTGDLETHDRACRRLAHTAGVVVVAVDYRRAPEHPWPAAIDDAIATIHWVATGPDVLGDITGRVGVAGDSSGGLIVALASHRLRDANRGLMPDAQFLIYSHTDLAVGGGSMDTKGTGYVLDRNRIEWSTRQWVPDSAMWSDPSVSPLRDPNFLGLPSTYVVTCEHDPLRDQGEQYAARTEHVGVPTVLRREPGLVHGFLQWDSDSLACAGAADRVALDVRTALLA